MKNICSAKTEAADHGLNALILFLGFSVLGFQKMEDDHQYSVCNSQTFQVGSLQAPEIVFFIVGGTLTSGIVSLPEIGTADH
jgi:hypothetical protein